MHQRILDKNNPEFVERLVIAINARTELHVAAALKAAVEKAEIKTETYSNPNPSEWDKVIDKQSILNAYPKELIQ